MGLDLTPIKELAPTIKELTVEVRALRKEMAVLIAILQVLSENPNTISNLVSQLPDDETTPLTYSLVLKEKSKKSAKPTLDD